VIEYSQTVNIGQRFEKRAAVVGGGLLGLEAAHIVQGFEKFLMSLSLNGIAGVLS